jgi:HSP20 family protein
MSTWEHFKDEVTETLHSIGDGWRALWHRASNALTHFSPTEDAATDQGMRWGIVAADLVDRHSELEISFEIPGLDKSDINIALHDRQLAVSGEKRFTRHSTAGDHIINERAYGRFKRSLTLPCDVQADNVAASYQQGILTIVLPKRLEPAGKTVPIVWR